MKKISRKAKKISILIIANIIFVCLIILGYQLFLSESVEKIKLFFPLKNSSEFYSEYKKIDIKLISNEVNKNEFSKTLINLWLEGNYNYINKSVSFKDCSLKSCFINNKRLIITFNDEFAKVLLLNLDIKTKIINSLLQSISTNINDIDYVVINVESTNLDIYNIKLMNS